MSTLFRKVLRDLLGRKVRNGLTLLGVILGVAGVVAITTANQDIVEAQRRTYNGSNQADLAVFTGDLSGTALNLVQRNNNVQLVDSRSAILTRFSVGDGQNSVRIFGIEDFAAVQLDVFDLVSGQFPSDDEIAFDTSTRDLVDIQIGDVVAIQRTPEDEIVYLTVSGFTRSPAMLGAGIANRATAYATAPTVRQMNGRRADNYLLARLHDPDLAGQTSSEIAGLLSKRGISSGSFTVRDPETFTGARELSTLLLLLRIFSILGAALASFLVANTISAVISEELSQIGIIKALGGTRRHIAFTYMTFSAVIGLVGATMGLGVGIAGGRALSAYLTDITGLQHPPQTVRALEVGIAIAVGLMVTMGATLVPAMRSARIRPAALLRAPGVRLEHQRRLFGTLTSGLARISRSAAIGLQNVMRRPGRTALTLTVVAVAVAAFVSTQALSDSVSSTADELYDLYGADAWIFFRQNTETGIVRSLVNEPAIVDAEAWASASGAIGSTRTDIWGMPVDDPLYQYRLLEGSWVANTSPPGVVLTANLANTVGATPGDRFKLDVGNRAVNVVIAGIVDDPSTYLGNAGTGKVFVSNSQFQTIAGRGNRSDLIALKLVSQDPEAVDAILLDLEQRYSELGPGTLAAYSDRQSTQQAIGILTQLLRAMVLIVGIVGVAGIANTLIINVTERRQEIGVLRSIGARSKQLLTMLVTEGLSLGLLGTLVGVAVGIPIAGYLVDVTGERLFELTFTLDTGTLIGSLVVGLTTVAAVSAFPGLIAARLKPIRVLRYE